VHETPVSAGLGIGVAALAAFRDVLAAGFSLGNLWVGHVDPLFHESGWHEIGGVQQSDITSE
jgi:hypothetical protein